MYTTQGFMTLADLQDMRELYDLDAWKDEYNPECPGHEVAQGEDSTTHWCGRDEECPEA